MYETVIHTCCCDPCPAASDIFDDVSPVVFVCLSLDTSTNSKRNERDEYKTGRLFGGQQSRKARPLRDGMSFKPFVPRSKLE